MTKKNIAILTGVVLLVIVSVLGYLYIQSVDVTLNLRNISKATVKYNGITLVSADKSGTISFRAPKSSSIVVEFIGISPYESSSRTLNVLGGPLVAEVSPYYSKQELSKQATQQSEVINAAVASFSPVIPSLYSIDSIKVYHYGEWASAKLTWIGEETENSDTLRVVLKKTRSNTWVVVNKPDILLFRDYYADVPLDILKQINNS